MSSNKDVSLKDIWDKLDESQDILRDIAKWLRFQNISKLKDVLLTELDDDQKKIAFESTDGKIGYEEVAKIAEAKQMTVYGWWNQVI